MTAATDTTESGDLPYLKFEPWTASTSTPCLAGLGLIDANPCSATERSL